MCTTPLATVLPFCPPSAPVRPVEGTTCTEIAAALAGDTRHRRRLVQRLTPVPHGGDDGGGKAARGVKHGLCKRTRIV